MVWCGRLKCSATGKPPFCSTLMLMVTFHRAELPAESVRESTTSFLNVHGFTVSTGDGVNHSGRSTVMVSFQVAALPVNAYVLRLGRWQGNVTAFS